MGQHGSKWPTRDTGFVAVLKRYKLWILAVLALAAAAFLLSCTPPARADSTGTLAVTVSSTVAGDTITVTTTFRPGADDGRGGLDGFIVRTGTNAGAPRALADSVSLGSSARSHTAQWVGNPVGVYSGYACVTARRRQLNSTPTCKAWSATVDDAAPPPPIVDSVQVAALRILPDTFTLAIGTAQTLCLAAEFPNGGAALWGEHEESAECRARLAAAYPNRRALTVAESAYLFASENCYPTDGRNPANGTFCRKRGTPS